jgi:serine/threonine protein kinase
MKFVRLNTASAAARIQPAPRPPMSDLMPDGPPVLAAKYRVERCLGEGAFGRVFAARHVELGHLVAVKVMKNEARNVPGAVRRFLQEARVVARMRSQHVARVLDMGTLETGAPYLVLEHLEGEDLASLLLRAGPLPAPQAVLYLLQACHALAEAHGLGVVHRDLKPANLFVTRGLDGEALLKVLDFGISKMRTASVGPTLTKSHGVLGSPEYMAPEQIASPRDVDPRADLWSLGVILHELVVGRRPFDAPDLIALCVAVSYDPTPRLGSDAPAGLQEVVERCLAKKPEGRYDAIAALAAALVPFGGPEAPELGRQIAAISGRAA